jgi:tetratricopeptide (TPR) repeat protein
MHTLALAERDAGQADSALQCFLEGRQLADVVDPAELDKERNETYYGNIGRCLHFLGQIESSLTCYQKSALIIERNPVLENVVNQAYIRQLIGELLIGLGQYELAGAFLRAAARKWEQVSPPKAFAVTFSLRQIESRARQSLQLPLADVERICMEWIFGRDAAKAMAAVRGR